jgi:hypothetical protein
VVTMLLMVAEHRDLDVLRSDLRLVRSFPTCILPHMDLLVSKVNKGKSTQMLDQLQWENVYKD